MKRTRFELDRGGNRRSPRRRRPKAGRLLGRLLLLAAPLLSLAGCAAVPPYEREYLSDPIMDLSLAARADSRDQKWLEAREGSTGGSGGAGGGCACN